MAGEAALALTNIMSILGTLRDLNNAIPFGEFLCPRNPPSDLLDIVLSKRYDYVIVGGGTAGLVLANRLSACPKVNVLVLEAGGCPPLEAIIPRPIALQSRTKFDYNFTSVNDNRTCQSLQGQVAPLTQGKMLGGSSSIFHMIVTRGAPPDYDPWVQVTNDSSWSYESLLPYFKRSEDVYDKPILREFGAYHGTNGPTIMQKQLRPENEVIFDAHEELGLPKLIDTVSRDSVLGIVDPLFQIGHKYRQSSLVSYLYPIKDRPNLVVLTGATVNKIIIVDKVATGVQYVYNNLTYTVSAEIEVIVSAGAFRTPQLLMLSGIGPAEHLTSKGIPVIVDLPVGQNLQDHVSGALGIAILNDTDPDPPLNPFRFAIPLTQSYYNPNKSATYADNFGINLYFHRNSKDTMEFCLNLFIFSVPVCQIIYEANLLSAVELIATGLAHPVSRGEVKLNTTDINDQPLVYMKYLTEQSDLEKLGDFIKYLAGLVETPAMKKKGGVLIDFGICTEFSPTTDAYWQCVALTTSCTVWHYCGTASMGSVVDTNLLVNGVSKLRVVDASVIPYITGGNINAVVLAVAEKIADVILASNPNCPKKTNPSCPKKAKNSKCQCTSD